MSATLPLETSAPPTPLQIFEDSFSILALSLMTALPVIEMIARNVPLVRHPRLGRHRAAAHAMDRDAWRHAGLAIRPPPWPLLLQLSPGILDRARKNLLERRARRRLHLPRLRELGLRPERTRSRQLSPPRPSQMDRACHHAGRFCRHRSARGLERQRELDRPRHRRPWSLHPRTVRLRDPHRRARRASAFLRSSRACHRSRPPDLRRLRRPRSAAVLVQRHAGCVSPGGDVSPGCFSVAPLHPALHAGRIFHGARRRHQATAARLHRAV